VASPSPLLPELIPGLGHNSGPEPTDPVAAVKNHLDTTYGDLVARFIDLELGCARVPDPIENGEDAGLVTDFVAQCQVHVKEAETAHRVEKTTFLEGGRIVDKFFKRRCENLNEALVPVLSRLKAYRDQREAERAERHSALLEAAGRETARAADYHAEAQCLATSIDAADRRRAVECRALAHATAESAAAMRRDAAACLEPVRIEGDYGATAYVTHSWAFEVVDLDAVPRCFLGLNAETIRGAITKDGVRDIPGLRIFRSEHLRVRGAA
jgi:hypothetical protein